MYPVVTVLNLERETKGTFLFKTNDTSAPINNVYVRKSAFSGKAPGSIKVTIEAGA